MKHLIHARSSMVSRLMIVLVASASAALAACGGSSTSSPSAAPSPSGTPVPPFDACLVGTWTMVGQSQNSPADDEDITFSGGAGEVFTINAQGDVTIDTTAAAPVVFVSAGDTFYATVSGTGRGSLTTAPSGTKRVLYFTPSA